MLCHLSRTEQKTRDPHSQLFRRIQHGVWYLQGSFASVGTPSRVWDTCRKHHWPLPASSTGCRHSLNVVADVWWVRWHWLPPRKGDLSKTREVSPQMSWNNGPELLMDMNYTELLKQLSGYGCMSKIEDTTGNLSGAGTNTGETWKAYIQITLS